MKFVASVSFVALALAGCAANNAPPPALVTPVDAAPAAAVAAGEPARTPEGARQFIAAVEKDLFDLSVIGGRAAWVNATYVNDDTDALAAYFGTIGTEKGVQYAKEAAEWLKVKWRPRGNGINWLIGEILPHFFVLGREAEGP